MKTVVQRRLNERGAAGDLIALAITLPVIIYLILASADISRIVMAKSQLYHAMNAAFDYLIIDVTNADNLPSRRLNGRDWCGLIRDASRVDTGADACLDSCEFTAPSGCTFSHLSPGATWQGASSLNLARNAFIDQLKGSGVFGFQCDAYDSATGALDAGTVSNCDLALKLGLYYLVTRGLSVDTASSLEIVKYVTIAESSVDGIGNFVTTAPAINLASYVQNKFVTGGNALGFEYAVNKGTHVPVVAMWGALRVRHNFIFPSWLKMGEAQKDGSYSSSQSIISATIFRPLPRALAPYGASITTASTSSTTTSTAETTTSTAESTTTMTTISMTFSTTSGLEGSMS